MSVLVIGGGITGLAAARALARDGVPVTLAEAGPRLGGKIATERVGRPRAGAWARTRSWPRGRRR